MRSQRSVTAVLFTVSTLGGERDAALAERVDPLWDPLRDDPRFVRLLGSSGTPR